jgi:hypothetical protein
MEVAYFAAGAFFSVAQHLLARKMLDIASKPGRSALYIGQLLILSLGLLVLMYFISESALVAAAIGLVAASITLAVVNSLKR